MLHLPVDPSGQNIKQRDEAFFVFVRLIRRECRERHFFIKPAQLFTVRILLHFLYDG